MFVCVDCLYILYVFDVLIILVGYGFFNCFVWVFLWSLFWLFFILLWMNKKLMLLLLYWVVFFIW